MRAYPSSHGQCDWRLRVSFDGRPRLIGYGYGKAPIVSGFSLQLGPGKRVLIVGENGSGKTTLANMVAGRLRPTEGDLTLPSKISAVTLPVMFPPIAVRDMGVDPAILRRLDIAGDEVQSAYPEQLSVGQQQKVSLALALSKEADLYILDEPVANMDSRSKAVAMSLVMERTQGKALVVIMHGHDEYSALFDSIRTLEGRSSMPRETLVDAN